MARSLSKLGTWDSQRLSQVTLMVEQQGTRRNMGVHLWGP